MHFIVLRNWSVLLRNCNFFYYHSVESMKPDTSSQLIAHGKVFSVKPNWSIGSFWENGNLVFNLDFGLCKFGSFFIAMQKQTNKQEIRKLFMLLLCYWFIHYVSLFDLFYVAHDHSPSPKNNHVITKMISELSLRSTLPVFL